MKNEKILIIGDSYSTFKDCIPEGYLSYYPYPSHPDVTDASKTWWNMLASETGSEIVLNSSWSGAPVCNIGWTGDCSESSSFIYRLQRLIDEGFFDKNRIDRVLVFGGTNDSWIGNPCGECKYSDWTKDDLDTPLPGYCCFIDKLLSVVPKENIHIIINCELREEYERGVLEICRHYGLSYTLLHDIDKIDGHPTHAGFTAIKNQVLDNI